MGFMESMGFGTPEVSQAEKKRVAYQEQLDKLIARRNAIMANQAKGLKARTGESNVETSEVTTINDNIKILENQIADLQSGKNIPWYDQGK